MNSTAAARTREQMLTTARLIAETMPDDTLAFVLSYDGPMAQGENDVTRAILAASREEAEKRAREKVDREERERAYWRSLGVTRHGIRYEKGDGAAGWTGWAVFPASVSDDEAVERLGWESYRASVPGGSYAHPAYVRRSRSRVLVTQDGGLDI